MTTTKLESQHRLVFHTRSRIPHCLRRNKRRHLLLTLLCLLALRDSRGHGDTSKRRRGNYGEDDVDDFSPRHRRRRPPPPQQSRSRSQPQPPFPGNLHHVYDDPFDDSNGKPNYFERHRMLPPPILSRSDRHRQRHRRRQLQEEPREEEDGDGGNATHGDLESESNLELELIAEEARRGDDPASRLRADLLRQYDRNSYPWEYAWASQYGNEDQWEAVYRTGDDNDYDDGENVVEGADKLESTNVTPTSLSPSSSFTSSSSSSSRRKYGVPVELDINFHRVFHVDVISPTIDMIVWFRLLWADPRLTWDPVDYGNLTKTWFYVADGSAGGETSELWTPDIQLWNLETGLAHGLEDAYAIVQHDGRVYWSRPGHLRPACKFDGLDRFPFDHLTCQMEFGSWAFSGKYIRLAKADGVGFNVGGSDTAGQSYNEFSFLPRDPIQCRIRVYPPYPSSEDEDWPVLLYDVTVRRAWQPYVRGYLTVQTLLNVIGFSAFWLPPPCGERMGLSISAILAAVASEIVISANLPQASEYTWFQKFSLLSLAFAFLSLMESVVVLYFYYKRSEDMVPWWFTKARMWYWERQKKAIEASVEVGSMAAEKGRDTVVRAKDSLVSVGAKIVNNDNDNDNVHKDVDGDTEGHRNCNIQQSVSHKRASFKENGDDRRHADGLDDLNEGKSEMRETQQQQYLTTTVDENGDDHDGNWDDDYHRDDDNIITPRTGTAVKHANPSYQLDSVTNTADDIMIDDRNPFDTANETTLFAAVTASPTPTTQSRNQSQRQSSQSAEEHYRNSFQSSISSLGNSKEVLEKLKLPNSRGMETSSAPPVVLLGESNRNEATSTVPRIGLRSSLRSSGRFHTMATQPSQYNPSKMEPHSANSAPSAIPNDTARRPSALRSSAYDPRHMETTSRPNRRRSRPGPERSRRRLLVDAESAHDFRMMHGGVGVGGGGERGWGGMDNESTMSLVVGPRDADDFNNEDEIENNLYWKLVAARIDDVARFWVPFTFVICLAVVLAEVM